MMISVVLPAYQEAENLGWILPKLNQSLKRLKVTYEVLVIDTMEPMDATKSICEENGAIYIPRVGGDLYGDAMRTGFLRAEGQYIVVMDADGSHDPDDIIRFYSEMERGRYDLIIGSRYCKGGQIANNFILHFMSWALNITYHIFFGLNVKDVSDSFRMYRTSQLKRLSLECDNFDVVEEILIQLQHTVENFRVKEIPILFSKRVAGRSKRDLMRFIMSYLRTIRRLWRIKKKIVSQ